MENKIKQIQQYFKDQIFAWNFTYLVENKQVKILIDWEYNFCFSTLWWVAFQSIFGTPEEHFMDLQFSQEESEQIWAIFDKILFDSKLIEQKEKDLKEYERIKNLYNLI